MDLKKSYSSQKKEPPIVYAMINNKKFETFVKGKKVNKNIFIKINIMEYKNTSLSYAKLFTHIGELHLFEYILQECITAKDKIFLHDQRSIPVIHKALDIAKSTQTKYLALLVKKELLLRDGKGYYKINPKYVEI